MAFIEHLYSKKLMSPPGTSLWRFGPSQVIFIVVGISCSLLINQVLLIFPLINMAGGTITLNPGIVVPLFCGVVAGPIAGFLTGAIGTAAINLLSYHDPYWNWCLGSALLGFLAGFPPPLPASLSRGMYGLVSAEIASLIAILVGTGIAALSDVWVMQIDFSTATGEFYFAGITNLFNGLLLLPLTLMTYNAGRIFIRRLRQTRHAHLASKST